MTEEGSDIPLALAEARYMGILGATESLITERMAKMTDRGETDRNLQRLTIVDKAAHDAVKQMDASEVRQMTTYIMWHHSHGVLQLIKSTETNTLIFELEQKPGWHSWLFLALRSAIAIELCWQEQFPSEMLDHTGAWPLILGYEPPE